MITQMNQMALQSVLLALSERQHIPPSEEFVLAISAYAGLLASKRGVRIRYCGTLSDWGAGEGAGESPEADPCIS